MRNLLRLALLCAALLSLVSVGTAVADRDEKSSKADKADKADKAERKADRDRERNRDRERPRGRDRNDNDIVRAGRSGDEVEGRQGPGENGDGDEKVKDDGSAPAPIVGALADQVEQPGGVRHPEHTTYGERIAAAPHAGTITIQVPGADGFTPLIGGASIPVGSYVDASEGLVEIGAEASPGGTEQNAVVTGSTFRVGQDDQQGVTILSLKGGDFSDCDDRGQVRARSAARRKGSGDVARGIWAAGKGRFRTKGRHGAATVRGTRWSTVDRCHSTTVKVFEGIVDVNDFGLGKVVAVAAGERYVARERNR